MTPSTPPARPLNWLRRLDLSTVISVGAFLISVGSLYYAWQSDLRQLEQLVVTDGNHLELDMSSQDFRVTKTFLVSNISDRVIALQSINLDVQRPTRSKGSARASVSVDGNEVLGSTDLNLVVKPGEVVTVTATVLPSLGPRASAFLATQTTGDNAAKLAALCRQLGIDAYDNPLSDAQREMCPSFRQYRGKHNGQFMAAQPDQGDVLMLTVRTHRDSRFASDRYKLEIGGSVL